MPSNTRYATRGRNDKIPPIHPMMWRWLCDIAENPPAGPNYAEFDSIVKVRTLWLLYAEQIVAQFAHDPSRTGMRPGLWWRWMAPRVSDIEVDDWSEHGPHKHAYGVQLRSATNEPEGGAVGDISYLGIPHQWSCEALVTFERQYDYLKRHRRLLTGEKFSLLDKPVEVHYVPNDSAYQRGFVRVKDGTFI